MKLYQKFFLPIVLATSASFAFHPADLNQDDSINDTEFVTYAGLVGTSDDSALVAGNIWKHGEDYSAITDNSVDYYIPSPSTGESYVALESLSVEPAVAERIIGLPSYSGGYTASYQVPGVDEVSYESELYEDSGEYFLVAPPHPVTPAEGGILTFTIYPADQQPSAANAYYIGQVTVAAIQPASFGISELRTKASTLISRLEARNDIDFSDYFTGGPLVNGPFENEGQMQQVIAMRFLADPQFPGGLIDLDQEILSGTDPEIVALRNQIEALIEGSGLESYIDEYLNQFPSDGGAAALAALPKRTNAKSTARSVNPTDAATLNKLMREQHVAEQMLTSNIFSPQAGAALSAIGLAGAPGKVATAPVSVTITALRVEYESIANTYPASGTITAEYSQTEFLQDECENASWTASATVQSKGWSIDGVATDVALTAIGAAGGVGEGIKAFKATASTAQVVDTGTRAALLSKTIETAETTRDFARDEIIKDYQNKNESKEVPAKTWSDIPLTPQYANMVQNGSILTVTEGTDAYLPSDTGAANVFIRAQLLGPNAFPSGSLNSSPLQLVTVREARVDLSGCPPNRYEPGQSYTITAQLANVRDPGDTLVRFDWSLDGAGTLSQPTDLGGGASQVTWTAPDPAPTELVTITAEAVSAICVPIGAANPQASCTSSGKNFELQVSPQEDCYEVGDTVTITLVDLNSPNSPPNVDFTQTSGFGDGSLSKTGPNTAELTATDPVEIGFTAEPNGDNAQLQFGAIAFGCDEPVIVQIFPDLENPGNAQMSFLLDSTKAYSIYGSFSDNGSVISGNFTAQSNYDRLIAEIDDPLDYPPFGTVGNNAGSGTPIVIPAFSFSFSISYTRGECNPNFPLPLADCLDEQNSDNTVLSIVGPTQNLSLDPVVAGSVIEAVIPIYSIYLISE